MNNKTSWQEETPKETEETRSVHVSELDAYINDRLKSQPKKEADIKVIRDERPGFHQLSLPDELKEYEKKYAFRWIMKDKRSIDYHLDVRGWTILNRSIFPNLPKHLFTVNGSIERGDSILGLIPKKEAERLRKEPGEKSSNMIKNMYEKHQDDPRYYTPDGGTNEDKFVQQI